ncbi:transcription elongation factor GreA [Chthonomonas calidirosea]|uniref:Transcription elongation factor GreA n=1 Tax=Chthonomonas calidirosea (strain DSM 23976 / ICMP 18418 / T49) TaxID=1303518 RepID=S0EZI7_CHTCT|nr:transcription elongation factor GreA [Chthonomonas calidirosea]CCW35838.1 transcription elongation factor GreA [Chthonomonas calidirosea T49]CEK18071.1 transcription elongation factor GreA [Chthonomonas calidirosea]CEK18072.1 transcription elongation factor GreA [Chthonomonas calidirosea]CEK19096.1 transcription elongation factor GreA [Chthonomonas calidirosea]
MSEDSEIVLTPGGHAKLRQRLDYLRNVQRPDIARRLRAAKEGDDLTENSEYETAKQEQALVESEILELGHLLQMARVVDDESIPTDHVGIGSIVAMTNLESGARWEFTLVSSAEADPDHNLISDESPIGKAVMGKKVGDIVSIRVPKGIMNYRIESIRK